MNETVARQLLEINQNFYSRFSVPFSETRLQPQPGFDRILDKLTFPVKRLLDIGCSDGRLGRFLDDKGILQGYVGVDFSREFIAWAKSGLNGDFFRRDLSQQGCLDGLGQFETIACLATLQHIPGRANRLRLFQECVAHLVAEGHVVLSNWQFTENVRQQRKIVPWSRIGLTADEVETNDYLLSWQRGGFALRYVCYIDAKETATLAKRAGLSIISQFRSDGREGNLNLYTILKASVQRSPASDV